MRTSALLGILVVSLGIMFFVGCNSMNWSRWIGAHTANWTVCVVPDSNTNRISLAQAIRSVASRCGLQENTIAWREGMVRFSAPIKHDTNNDIISFVSTNSDKESGGISLYGYVRDGVPDGKLRVTLFQQKWRKTRTSAYIKIQNTLLTEFKERFGAQVDFKIYDDVIK